MPGHAILSPSSAHRWMRCAASAGQSAGVPDSGNEYTDEGTAAHFLAAHGFNGGHPSLYIGRSIDVVDGVAHWSSKSPKGTVLRMFPVDAEMAANVNAYVQAVRKFAAGGTLLVEQSIPIGEITGEEGACGTADAVVFTADGELQIHDFKYGRQEVEAEENEQLLLYAAGALDEYEEFGPFSGVRLIIHQPRAGGIREWLTTVEHVRDFAVRCNACATTAAEYYASAPDWLGTITKGHAPSEIACKWCRGKANCPAAAQSVETAIDVEFDDLTAEREASALDKVKHSDGEMLAKKLAACDFIESWIKAVRAEVERRLLSGEEVPGYKLVQGKKGPRRWKDPAAAEAMLKSMRLKIEEMYDMTLISPTSAEKIFGEKGTHPSAKRWNKLQTLIVQKEGEPSVAPMSDPRPMLTPQSPSFEDETGGDIA